MQIEYIFNCDDDEMNTQNTNVEYLRFRADWVFKISQFA